MLEAGTPAPEVSLPTLAGGSWKLSDALRSAPVLLAFFKVSCPTCQLTLPFLSRIPNVVAVSQDDAAGTRDFGARFGSLPETVLDAGPRYTASNAYGITHVPSLFLVGSDGKIAKAIDGFSKADLEELGVRFAPNEKVPALRPG